MWLSFRIVLLNSQEGMRKNGLVIMFVCLIKGLKIAFLWSRLFFKEQACVCVCVCVKFVALNVLPADVPSQYVSIQHLGYPDWQIESQYWFNEVTSVWDSQRLKSRIKGSTGASRMQEWDVGAAGCAGQRCRAALSCWCQWWVKSDRSSGGCSGDLWGSPTKPSTMRMIIPITTDQVKE